MARPTAAAAYMPMATPPKVAASVLRELNLLWTSENGTGWPVASRWSSSLLASDAFLYDSPLMAAPTASIATETEPTIQALWRRALVSSSRRGDDAGRARRQSGWILVSVAVAMLAVGGPMSGLSWKKAADANKLIDQRDALGRPIPFAEVQTEFNGLKGDAKTYGGVAIGMYAAGAVCLGIATYLFVSSRGKPHTEQREARLRLVPVLDPHNAGLVAGMEF